MMTSSSTFSSPPPSGSIPTEYELSPSKARLAATTSLAWTRIRSWLATLFSPAPVPSFEQNPATLAYLQQLMQVNLTADQMASMQSEVDREQLNVYEAASASATTTRGAVQPLIMSTILSDCLNPKAHDRLDNLARTKVLLSSSTTTTSSATSPSPSLYQHDLTSLKLRQEWEGNIGAAGIEADGGGGSSSSSSSNNTPTPADNLFFQLGQSIHLLTHKLFSLENQVRDLKALSTQLSQNTSAAQSAAVELQNRLTGALAEAELERMRLCTAQWARETKQISLKTDEYERRIAALVQHVQDENDDNDPNYYADNVSGRADGAAGAGAGAGAIELIGEIRTRIEAKRSEVKALEQRLSAFHALPPDVEASRDEVKRAQRELEQWKTKREHLFEQI